MQIHCTRRFQLRLALSLTLTPVASLAPQSAPDLQAVARTLVTQSAGIRAGEKVMVFGSPRDMALLGHLAIEVMRAGGQPLVSVWTDTLGRRSYDEVPAEFDGAPQTLNNALSDLFDAWLSVDLGEAEGMFAGVPPERIAARNKAGQEGAAIFRKRGTRLVNLGNGLYPTATLARRLGLAPDALAAAFWKGVGSDPAALHATGERLKAAFAAGTKVSVTHPNGTDFTFRCTGRNPAISDGSLANAQLGTGVSPFTWLPAGEFQLAPVPGTAEGKIVIDRMLWNGTPIEGLTLTFSRGRLTSMSARSGLEPLKARYDAAGQGKDVFGNIDLGFNPDVRLPLNTGWIVWMQAGAVTFIVGDNSFVGGENTSDFSFSAQQGGTTVKIDGRAIVENGALK
jgi:leucyl aminopeptidase (aminopeptidase T)